MEEKAKTVAAIMQDKGTKKLSESIIAHIDSYRHVGPVHEGIIRTKIRGMSQEIEGNPELGKGNGLVLIKYFSTEDDHCGGYQYTDRFSLFYKDDILAQFQAIPVFDFVIGSNSRWTLLNYFDLSDLDLILLAKFERWPKQLLWHWSRWQDILRSELLGTAQKEEQSAVVELTAKYMEYLLGNLEESSEVKTFPHFVMPEYVSSEDINSERRMYLIRDRVLNELSLYGEVRCAFRQLTGANSD